jgi:hypothetical protein
MMNEVTPTPSKKAMKNQHMVSILTILLTKCQETILQGIRATKQEEKPHILNGYKMP